MLLTPRVIEGLSLRRFPGSHGGDVWPQTYPAPRRVKIPYFIGKSRYWAPKRKQRLNIPAMIIRVHFYSIYMRFHNYESSDSPKCHITRNHMQLSPVGDFPKNHCILSLVRDFPENSIFMESTHNVNTRIFSIINTMQF